MAVTAVAIGGSLAGGAAAAAVTGYATFGAALAAGSAMTYAAVAIGTSLAISYAANEVLGLTPDAPSMPGLDDKAQGLLTNEASPVAPIPVVYGFRKVGGTRVFIESTGEDNKYLHQVIVLSEGEVNSIENVYLNDVLITDSKYGDVVTDTESTNVTAQSWSYGYAEVSHGLPEGDSISLVEKYSNSACTLDSTYGLTADGKKVWVSGGCRGKFKVTDVEAASGVVGREYAWYVPHTGADDQSADSRLVSDISAWTTSHRLRGTAYIYVRLTFDQEIFPSGLPIITADIKGVKVYDPRTSTTAWSDNPALCIRDYLTNTRYGRGIPTSMIDDASIIAAANYCDETVTKGGTTAKRYKCNGIVDTSRTSLEIVRELLTACRGMLVFSGGKYKLIIDKPETASFTFNEDNIVGAWQISMGSKTNTYNRIRAEFFNPDRSWQGDIAVVDSSTLRTQDSNLMLEREIQLPFTSDIYTAKQIATMALNQSRQQIMCSFTSTIEGTRCEVGDVVYVSHETPGWTNKEFRVMSIALKNNDEVEVALLEYADSVYDFGTIAVVDDAPNTNLPDPDLVTAPDAMGINETLFFIEPNVHNRVTVEWQHNATAFVARYELQYQLITDSAWTNAGRHINQIVTIDDLDVGTYNFRVRAINSFGAASSWLTITNQAVQGANVLPAVDVPAINGVTESLYVTTNGSGVKAKARLTWSTNHGA